jgi:hypothetical protein
MSLCKWMLAFQESHYYLQRRQSLKALEFFKCHKPLTQHHSVTAQKTQVTMLKHTQLRTELRKLPATSTMYSTSWSGLFVIRSATHTMGLCKDTKHTRTRNCPVSYHRTSNSNIKLTVLFPTTEHPTVTSNSVHTAEAWIAQLVFIHSFIHFIFRISIYR